jgi:hypothetical protein
MTGTTATISISRNRTSRAKLRAAVRARTALIKFSDRYDVAAMRPHRAVLKTGHFSGFNRGLESFQSIADFLSFPGN